MKRKILSPQNLDLFIPECEDILETSQSLQNEDFSTLQSPRSVLSENSTQLLKPEKFSLYPKSSPKGTSIGLEASKCFFSFNSAHESEINCLSPINKLNCSLYSNEIEACKGEINRLRSKISKIQKESFDKRKKDQSFGVSIKEMNQKLQKQRENLNKQFKMSLSRQKREIFLEFQKEFEKLNEKVLNKYKAQQKLIIAGKQKELEEFFANELIIIEAEFEEKLSRKSFEFQTKQELVIEKLTEENQTLRKQNKVLTESLEDCRIKLEEVEELSSKAPLVNEKCLEDLNELTEKYSRLKQEFECMKIGQDKRLCDKCKAYTDSSLVVTRQLARLKDYLELGD